MLIKNLLFLLYLSSFILHSQEKKDSILFYLENAKGLNTIPFLEKAVKLSNEQEIDSLYRAVNYRYGLNSYFSRDTLGLEIARKNLLKYFKYKKDSASLSDAYFFKAYIHRINYKLDSSFYSCNKAKNIAILIKDSIRVAKNLHQMAVVQWKENDLLGSEISAIEGIKYVESKKGVRVLDYLYNTLGIALNLAGKNKEARFYFNKAINLCLLEPVKRIRESDYLLYINNIGITYYKEGNIKKALSLYKENLKKDSIEIKYPRMYTFLFENLSYSYFLNGNYTKAITGFKKVLKARKLEKNLINVSVSHTNLAEVYFKTKNYPLVRYHAKKGLFLGRKTGRNITILESLSLLSKVTKVEVANKYLEEYIFLKDSLVKQERNLKNQFAKIKYDTENKKKENNFLKLKNTITQKEVEKLKQQKTIAWLVAGVFLLFITLGCAVFYYVRKKLLYQTKLQQAEAREKERKKMAQSLHDEIKGDLSMLLLQLENKGLIREAKNLYMIKKNVRSLSHQLSSESFNDVSFRDQIVNLVSDFYEDYFIINILELESIKWKMINNVIKRTLYLVVRESIQNAKKYSEATILNLVFSQTKKTVCLTITDNGKGFDTKILKKGIGIKNMKERIEELNGDFSIESETQKGTITKIEIIKNDN